MKKVAEVVREGLLCHECEFNLACKLQCEDVFTVSRKNGRGIRCDKNEAGRDE